MKTDWKCSQVEPRLTDYALGALSSHEEARVQQHLEQCDACNEAAAQIAITLELTVDALEHAPAPLPLERPVTQRRANRMLRTLRAWIDAPEATPITLADAPGILARAALILLLPLALFFGLLVPSFRMAWHDLHTAPTLASAEDAAARPVEETVILVNILEPPSIVEPESLASLTTAPQDGIRPNHLPDEAATRFDEGFDVWNTETASLNQLPLGTWYLAGTNEQRMNLSKSSMPILALRVAQTGKVSQTSAPFVAQHGKPKVDGHPRLIDTLARPPATTNRQNFESIRPQEPAPK